jgi:hypothetical protein
MHGDLLLFHKVKGHVTVIDVIVRKPFLITLCL